MATKTIPNRGEIVALVRKGSSCEPVPRDDKAALRARFGRLGSALLWLPVRLVSRFVPKDPDLWLFGGEGGQGFEGNARHLFQWIATHRPGVKAIWCTDDKALLAKLEERELPCVSTYSKAGTKLAMRAGVAVTSHGVEEDLHRFAIAGSTALVLLGSGALTTRTGADASPATNESWLRSKLGATLEFVERMFSATGRFDILTVSSESQQSHARSAWQAPRESIVVTGHARTDLCLQRSLCADPGVRRILIAPSGRGYRVRGETIDFFGGFDAEAADRALGAVDAEIYIKAEPWIRPQSDAQELLARSSRVHIFECGDLHHHLDGFDVLVTDVSPLLADFLLFDRPILFMEDGMEEEGAGGASSDSYYDADWLRCGPSVRSWPDLLDAVSGALQGPDEFRARRSRTRDVFHAHVDGRNCERISAAIDATLRELG